MNWKKWLNSRAIKPLKTGKEQAPRLIKSSKDQIGDAETIFSVNRYSAARDQAYEAMLKAGMALILAHGYRPESGSHHKTTVNVTAELLGPEHRGLIKAFNDLRKNRNERLYSGYDYCTKADADRAIKQAHKLVSIIEGKIKEQE